MNEDKQINSTDWLTKGYNKEELARMKAEAIKEAEAEIRDKQIDEMAEFMTEGVRPWAEDAEALYNAGYRKASEVAREIFEDMAEALDATVSALFLTSETLVDVSKSHISKENAINDIRNYLNRNNVICSQYRLREIFAELKKKYTEGEE